MKKQSLLKGTFILGGAGILAKFLGLFFRWPLIMLIGDEGIGYYQMSYPLYMFFIAVASGIPVAISKMVSERSAIGDRDGSIQVLKNSLFLMVILGGGFSAFLLLFSKQLISFFQWDMKAYYSLIAISFAPFIISIISAFRGFFQGMQNMYPTAVSQIIEQIGRVCVGVGLAYVLLPRGIEYSAGGAALGAAAGGLFAVIYLISKYLKIRKEFSQRKTKRNSAVLGRLLQIAIPVSLGATASSIMSLIDSLLVPRKLLEAGFTFKESTILYGQLTGKAFVLVSVPLTLSIALCASLVPIITEAFTLNRKIEVIQKVETAIKLSMVIALPSALGLCFMASPVLNLVFPSHAEGYKILQYLALTIPFIIVTQTSTAILQGVDRYGLPVLNLAIGCIIKAIMTYVLVSIPAINVYGAVLASISGYVVVAILNMITLKRVLRISINYYDVMIKPAYASVLMIIPVVFIYMYVYNYTVSNAIACIVSIGIGVVFYVCLIVLFRIFRYGYIKKKIFKR